WLPALVAIAVLIAILPVSAHHPFTPYYDASKPGSVTVVCADRHQPARRADRRGDRARRPQRPMGVRRIPAQRVHKTGSERLQGKASTRTENHHLRGAGA